MNDLTYIELEHVSFHYVQGKEIIKNVNIAFKQNEFTAIVGPNGSGKTTIGKLMMGILKPTSGNVFIYGEDSRNMTLGQIGKRVGYLFQNPERQIFAPTVKEEIAFPVEFKGHPKGEVDKKVEEILQFFHLDHLKDSFPFTLSHGEKQRVALAGIFINSLPYFILDEPTTGLDMERKKILSQILQKFKKQGIGMAVISHDLSFVYEHADRIIEISRGEIIGDRRKKNGS